MTWVKVKASPSKAVVVQVVRETHHCIGKQSVKGLSDVSNTPERTVSTQKKELSGVGCCPEYLAPELSV